ncbi:MAG: class I SAM-dependent methyltransferase [Planctomycetota bacterium]
MTGTFDHCAEDYARYRPPYPQGVFSLLAQQAGRTDGRLVADVGAGTGIFSRALAASGWRVVAVEPSPAMLGYVNRTDDASGGGGPIRLVCATAEATGLGGGSVALVTAAQAFHWFNPPYALAEFARILQPGGVLALTWNNRDASRSAFVGEYESLIGRYNPAYEREYRQQDWSAKIASCGAYEPAEYHRFDHVWKVPAEGLVGFSRSVSYIRNVLSREQQPRFEDDLRELMRRHFGDEDCEIPLRTDLWTARRR